VLHAAVSGGTDISQVLLNRTTTTWTKLKTTCVFCCHTYLVPVAAPAQLLVLYKRLRLLQWALRHKDDAVRESWVAYAQLVVLDLHTHTYRDVLSVALYASQEVGT
jgi:hypothetical protein